jgi:hypothetical protein
MNKSDSSKAERIIKWRIFAVTVLSFGLIASFYNSYNITPQTWIQWGVYLHGMPFALIILLALANGQEHRWSDSPRIRDMIGDETTRENRRRAQGFGFWAMIPITLGAAYLADRIDMPGHKAAYLVAVLTLAAAGLRFGALEQKALRGLE